MASIRKRNDKFNVVYDYDDGSGVRKQKWESFTTFAEANKRKIEIEKEKLDGIFIPPNAQTVKEFLKLFKELYGTKKWSLSTYEKSSKTIENYIVPYIGDMKIQSITPLFIEKFYADLKKKPAASNRIFNSDKKVSSGTIKNVHKVLRCSFGMAVKWNIIASNPFERVEPPKHVYKKRDIWTSDMILRALKVCDDPKLAIAIHLSFACSLRIGEVLGLQWDNVHISNKEINQDNAYIEVKQELVQASIEAMKQLEEKDVLFVFPHTIEKKNRKTVIVLKKPKTESSIRRVWLPKTLALILQKWKDEQKEYKDYFGDEYYNYNLVVCFEDGKQCSHATIRKGFEKLPDKANLPKVVFHSLRHSSTTYKLKINHGDIKATQGDTGHSQADMVTDVYSHILDEDRKVNAQKFDETFYQDTSDKQTDDKNNKTSIDVDLLISELSNSPELLNQLMEALKS